MGKKDDMKLTIQPKVISLPDCLKTEWSIDRVIPGQGVKALDSFLFHLSGRYNVEVLVLSDQTDLFKNTV